MKIKFDTDTMTFETKNDDEKVFALLGTKFGDGENYVTLTTEDELPSLGYQAEDWDRDVMSMEIGECATYSYWFYGKANIIVRLA